MPITELNEDELLDHVNILGVWATGTRVAIISKRKLIAQLATDGVDQTTIDSLVAHYDGEIAKRKSEFVAEDLVIGPGSGNILGEPTRQDTLNRRRTP